MAAVHGPSAIDVRQAEVEEVKLQQHRRAAHDLDVGGRERAQAAVFQPDEREHEPEGRGHRHRGQRDRSVDQRALQEQEQLPRRQRRGLEG